MCYGSGCRFEVISGECSAPLEDRAVIERVFGYNVCLIGGDSCSPEEDVIQERMSSYLDWCYSKVMRGDY